MFYPPPPPKTMLEFYVVITFSTLFQGGEGGVFRNILTNVVWGSSFAKRALLYGFDLH
jgi:hypothetical protein